MRFVKRDAWKWCASWKQEMCYRVSKINNNLVFRSDVILKFLLNNYYNLYQISCKLTLHFIFIYLSIYAFTIYSFMKSRVFRNFLCNSMWLWINFVRWWHTISKHWKEVLLWYLRMICEWSVLLSMVKCSIFFGWLKEIRIRLVSVK